MFLVLAEALPFHCLLTIMNSPHAQVTSKTWEAAADTPKLFFPVSTLRQQESLRKPCQ